MLLWRNEADCDAGRGSASEPAQQTAAAATATTIRPLPHLPLAQTLFPLKFNVLFSLCPARTHIRWHRALSLVSVFDFRPFYSKNVNESSDCDGSSSAAERQVNFHAHTHTRTQTKNARALPTRSGNNNRERCGNETWERALPLLHSLWQCEWTVECIEDVWNVFVSATKWTIWAISTNSSNSTVVFNWGKHTLTQRHKHAHARTAWAIYVCMLRASKTLKTNLSHNDAFVIVKEINMQNKCVTPPP